MSRKFLTFYSPRNTLYSLAHQHRKTDMNAVAAQLASLHSVDALRARLNDERFAFMQQKAHNRRVNAGPVGQATLDSLANSVATLRAAIAIKESVE